MINIIFVRKSTEALHNEYEVSRKDIEEIPDMVILASVVASRKRDIAQYHPLPAIYS